MIIKKSSIIRDGDDPAQYMNFYKAKIYYENGCEMENIRAYIVVSNLKKFTDEIFYLPEDILYDDSTAQTIREQGFTVYVRTDKTYEEMYGFFMQTLFLNDLELQLLDDDEFKESESWESLKQKVKQRLKNISQVQEQDSKENRLENKESKYKEQPEIQFVTQSMISVSVDKLDRLMDLMGEMVISEAMVTQNPDLKGLKLDNFNKAARQLHKITSELQDIIMSIRMVPLSATFHKMYRIVRDMSKKLEKEVNLEIIGEETEVDKNIIEHISDPLMHLIRNSIDHGIESVMDREKLGKPGAGTITLEARNVGSDVLVILRDDGKGLDKEKILKRARENGLIHKPEIELTDKEIYNFILLPGFSTNDTVSEFSGRGVGMDIVVKNIEMIGGSISISSEENVGTTFTLKIPLTLAIINGMNIKIGKSKYTIPTSAIKESFRPKKSDIITDPDSNEMIMVRGRCYPILRLHEIYNISTDITDISEGILIMVEHNDKIICIFADELLGEQQVVVKALPVYIKNIKKNTGLSGCTLLGDGSISLILDIERLVAERLVG